MKELGEKVLQSVAGRVTAAWPRIRFQSGQWSDIKMGTHHASVFLYRDYQREICGVVKRADQHDYALLQDRTCEAIQRLRQQWPLTNLGWVRYEQGVEQEVPTQEWPLLDHGGGGLPTQNEIRSISAPTSRDIGFWLLVILAEYLRPCPSPSGNWSVMNTVLEILGWRQSDRDLLFKSLPTSRLIKPRNRKEASWPLRNSDPYWLWLRPERARCGWLPLEEISTLCDMLQKMRGKIEVFDVRLIPDISTDNPVVVRDYEKYVQSGYQATLDMLSAAREVGQGLFMSTTLP